MILGAAQERTAQVEDLGIGVRGKCWHHPDQPLVAHGHLSDLCAIPPSMTTRDKARAASGVARCIVHFVVVDSCGSREQLNSEHDECSTCFLKVGDLVAMAVL